MESKYFYIVSQVEVNLVLEGGDQSGVQIILRRKNDNLRQLWKWNPDGTLANKYNDYVMDVKRVGIKRRTVLVVSFGEDANLNQGWHVMDDHIISNRNNLAVQSDVNVTGGLVMKKKSLNASQKWYFVPERAWEIFQNAYATNNPVQKLLFWREVVVTYIHVVLGCTLEEYKGRVKLCTQTIEDCAKKLNSVTKNTGITKIVSGGVAIASGAVTITGMVLAPFTAGVSLAFTVGGIVTGVSSGVTSAVSTAIDEIMDASEKRKMKLAITPALTATLCFHNLLHILFESSREAADAITNPNGIEYALKQFKTFRTCGNMIFQSLKLGGQLFNCIDEVKLFATLPKLVDTIGDLQAFRFALAADAAAPGIRIGTKTFVAAGSTAAKGISGSLAAVGMAFGIWDVYSGVKHLKNKNQLADQFLKSVEGIKNDALKLSESHQRLASDMLVQ